MQYISSKEAAERWGLTVRSVQYFCKQGRIPGAKFLGKQWMIPADACHPQNMHTAAKNGAVDGRYRFPLFIFSPAYSSEDSLTDTEKKLLEAQTLLLKEDQSACIHCCTNLIRKSTPTYILMGIWFSIAMASIPMGNHLEYRRALDEMESILKSEDTHQEDYRLLISYVKYQASAAPGLVNKIEVSALSSDALPFYQFFLLFSYAFIIDISPDVLRLCDSLCPQIRAEGILPLEAVMHLTLGTFYSKQPDLPRAINHCDIACKIAMENDWVRIPSKYSFVAEAPLRKCLGAREFEKIRKITCASLIGWKLINQIESGISLFDGASPEQLAVMYQIYFGSSYDSICSDLQISPAALKDVLKACYQITGTKNKAELKRYLKANFSSRLMD